MDQGTGEALFSPYDINQESLDLNLANSQLSKEELMRYGALTTTLRQRAYAKAETVVLDEETKEDITNVTLHHFNQGRRSQPCFPDSQQQVSGIDSGSKRKKRTKSQLLTSEIADVVDCVIRQKLSHEQTAAKFGIKRELVHSVMRSRKRDSKFLEKH